MEKTNDFKLTIENLFFLLKHQKKWIILFGLAAVLSAVLDAIGVGAVLPFVDLLQSEDAVMKYNRYISMIGLSERNYKELLCIVTISLAVIVVVKNIFLVVTEYIKNTVQNMLKVSISTSIYSNYLITDYNFFVVNPHGFLLQRITSMVNQVRAALSMLMTIAVNMGAVILVYIVMAFVSLKITLVITLVMSAFAVVTVYVSRYISFATGKEGVRLESLLYKTCAETIAGMRIVRTFCAEGFLKQKFDKITQRLARINIINTTIYSTPARAIESLFIILLCIFIVLASRGSGELASVIPLLAFFGAGLMRITQRVAPIYSSFMNLSHLLPSVNVIAELMRDVSVVKRGGREFRGLEKLIELKGVSFTYPKATDRKVLESLSLRIEKGQFIGIVGVSGSGKSTIVDLLLGLYTPSEGSILIDEKDDLEYIELESWRRFIGLVEQNTMLFNGTVKENIAFGVSSINMDDVIEAARLANAHDFICKLPNGYDTEVGEKGLKLSGGERQRLAIARALYRNPEIIILDEATSDLDSHAEKEVQKAIENVGGDKTVIVIAHRLSTVAKADKIFVLMDGKMVEEGTHAELIVKQGAYWELCRKQDLLMTQAV